jgi:hypothetical protein
MLYETRIDYAVMSVPPAILVLHHERKPPMNFEPIFGEDNETIGFVDDLGNEWTLEEADTYWAIAGGNPFERTEFDPEGWMDADALASAGWGTDEDYGYYGE